MINPFEPRMPESTTVVLDWVKVAVRERVSAEFAESISLETWRDTLSHELEYRLVAYVLADQLPPVHIERTGTTSLTAPASWRQAWKAEHPRIWRGWLLRRWPVRTVTEERKLTLSVDLKRYWTYPKQTFVHPQLGQPVRVATVSDGLTWWS